MTRTQYEANKSKLQCGGDFWNPAQIIRAAFRNQDVAALVVMPQISTGLWCDAKVVLNNGQQATIRLYA